MGALWMDGLHGDVESIIGLAEQQGALGAVETGVVLAGVWR